MTVRLSNERFPARSTVKIAIACNFLDDHFLESRAFPRHAVAPRRARWMLEELLNQLNKTGNPWIAAEVAEVTSALHKHGWAATLGWLRSLARHEGEAKDDTTRTAKTLKDTSLTRSDRLALRASPDGRHGRL